MGVESNHDHPLEEHASELVKKYLEKENFPFDRISVSVDFTFMSKASGNRIKVTPSAESGRLEGEVTLLYNSLYILQRPAEFFEEIVPHEVAHILNSLRGLSAGIEYKEHGEEWGRTLAKLQPKATPRSTGPGNIFDDRALLFANGGVAGMCSCPGLSGIWVASFRRKRSMHSAGSHCKNCNSRITPINDKEIPFQIQEQVNYIKEEKSIR